MIRLNCVAFLGQPSLCACLAGNTAPTSMQLAAFKPSANALMFGHLPEAAPRSLAQGKLLTRPNPAASSGASGQSHATAWHSQQQQLCPAQTVSTQPFRQHPSAAGGSGWEAQQHSSSTAKRPQPAAASWTQFETSYHSPSGGCSDAPQTTSNSGSRTDNSQRPAANPAGSKQPLQAVQQQQQHTRKQARATWQAPAGCPPAAACFSAPQQRTMMQSPPAASPVSQLPEESHIPPAGPPEPERCLQPDTAATATALTGNVDAFADLDSIFAFMR